MLFLTSLYSLGWAQAQWHFCSAPKSWNYRHWSYHTRQETLFLESPFQFWVMWKGHFLLCVGSRTHFSFCYCRDKLWGVCVSILALLPRVLRLMLQSLRVNRASPEELPIVGQLLRLLLQHVPLRTHMLTNAILVQQIIKNITVCSPEPSVSSFVGGGSQGAAVQSEGPVCPSWLGVHQQREVQVES